MREVNFKNVQEDTAEQIIETNANKKKTTMKKKKTFFKEKTKYRFQKNKRIFRRFNQNN